MITFKRKLKVSWILYWPIWSKYYKIKVSVIVCSNFRVSVSFGHWLTMWASLLMWLLGCSFLWSRVTLLLCFFEVGWLGAQARSDCWRAVDPFPCLQTDSEGSNGRGPRRGIAFPFPFPPQCSFLNGVCPPDLPGMKCHISDWSLSLNRFLCLLWFPRPCLASLGRLGFEVSKEVRDTGCVWGCWRAYGEQSLLLSANCSRWWISAHAGRTMPDASDRVYPLLSLYYPRWPNHLSSRWSFCLNRSEKTVQRNLF